MMFVTKRRLVKFCLIKDGGQGTILRVGCYALISHSSPHPHPLQIFGATKTKRLTEMTGPLKPRHAEFLQQLMAEYGGTRLTKVRIFQPKNLSGFKHIITWIWMTLIVLRNTLSAGAWKSEKFTRGATWHIDWRGKLLFFVSNWMFNL